MSQYCENCSDHMACAVSGCTGPLVCESCNDPIATPALGEPNLCRLCRKEGYIPEADLARGRAGLAALVASATAPGEDVLARVEEERQAGLERFENDLKGRG